MSLNLSVAEISSSQQVSNGYDLYLVDCSAGDIVLDLQEDYLGKTYFLKRTDSNVSHTLTVNGNNYQIQGQASRTIGGLQTLNIVRTSGEWVIFC